jgi:NADH:ubiquinone oxidoreductase subunit K
MVYIEFLTYNLLPHYIYIMVSVMFLSFIGVFVISYDLITILISVEMLLLISALNFIMFGSLLDPVTAQIFSIFILLTAAGETAVAFSIFIYYYNITESANIDFWETLEEVEGRTCPVLFNLHH